MVLVRAHVRGGAAGRLYNTAAVIDADGTYLGQVPQAPHPAGQGVLGEVLLPARQPRAARCSTPRSAGSACTSATTATSPRAGGRSAWPAPRSCSTRRRPAAGCRRTCGSSSSRRRRWPTSTSSARSTGSASRTSATTTSTARATSSTPGASSSATSASANDEELVVRDLDFDLIDEVRKLWAFYRDRRPDAYGSLVERDVSVPRRPADADTGRSCRAGWRCTTRSRSSSCAARAATCGTARATATSTSSAGSSPR